METPLVSICSITYNHAPFIRQCLDGFLMQQCNFPIEIIINDDCSTDGTTEIIREYAEKYPDKIFPIFHEENQYSKGVRGMAQKFVYPKARGKYIALCEGDDYWTDPLKLQKQVDFLESHPDYSMCAHRAQVVYEGVPPVNQNWYSKLNDCEIPIAVGLEPPVFPTASIMIRTEAALSAPTHKDFSVGDVVIHASAYARGRVYGMAESMAVYRRNPQAWSYSNDLRKNYKVQAIPHLLAMLEVFPRPITKHLKKRTSFYSYLWLRNYWSLRSILSIRYIFRVIRYCNLSLLFYFIVGPVSKVLRAFGLKVKLKEE